MRSTVSWPSISAGADAGDFPGGGPGANRLLGASNVGARLRRGLKRLGGLKSEVAARLDPGNCRREP